MNENFYLDEHFDGYFMKDNQMLNIFTQDRDRHNDAQKTWIFYALKNKEIIIKLVYLCPAKVYAQEDDATLECIHNNGTVNKQNLNGLLKLPSLDAEAWRFYTCSGRYMKFTLNVRLQSSVVIRADFQYGLFL